METDKLTAKDQKLHTIHPFSIQENEDYDKDNNNDDSDDGYSHEVFNIYDKEHDDDGSDNNDNDKNNNAVYDNNSNENNSQNNKAQLLLFNFSPEEVVKDA
eukprot:4611658-Ditylum_brightwellii.AAC.1